VSDGNAAWSFLRFGIVGLGLVILVVLLPNGTSAETPRRHRVVAFTPRYESLQIPNLNEVLLLLYASILQLALVDTHSKQKFHVEVDHLVDIDRAVVDSEFFAAASLLQNLKILG
jgi:hypothetical protein